MISYYEPTGLNEFDAYYVFTIPGVLIQHVDARITTGTPENSSYPTLFDYNNTDTAFQFLAIIEADENDRIFREAWCEDTDLFQVGDVFRGTIEDGLRLAHLLPRDELHGRRHRGRRDRVDHLHLRVGSPKQNKKIGKFMPIFLFAVHPVDDGFDEPLREDLLQEQEQLVLEADRDLRRHLSFVQDALYDLRDGVGGPPLVSSCSIRSTERATRAS
ncbi:MAG: hypothetical protein M0C28_18545 [Candidatus Moduliflexus flocculans]|nr:hypothetical protein [Candidatus Moduliflexus flocculans]